MYSLNIYISSLSVCLSIINARADVKYERLISALSRSRDSRRYVKNDNAGATVSQTGKITYQPFISVLLAQVNGLVHTLADNSSRQSGNHLENAEVKQRDDKTTNLKSEEGNTDLVEELEVKGELAEEFLTSKKGLFLSIPSYSTFEKYLPYVKHAIKISTYLVPGLGQYKQVMLGLEIIRIACKLSDMYKQSETWYSMAETLAQETLVAIGRRDDVEAIISSSTQASFIDVSSVDMDTFLKLVEEMPYPSLSEYDECIVRKDIGNVVDAYVEDIKEEDKQRLVETLEKAIKFIALHEIIPTVKIHLNK